MPTWNNDNTIGKWDPSTSTSSNSKKASEAPQNPSRMALGHFMKTLIV